MRRFILLLLLLICPLAEGQRRAVSQPPRGFVSGEGTLQAFMAALDADQTTGLQVLGDSTGSDTNEWVYLTAQWLGTRYPGHTVKYILFSDATQRYGAATTIQTGTDGERYASFTGTKGMFAAATDITDIGTDLDIRVDIAAADYRPAAQQGLVARLSAVARSFRFQLGTGGKLAYQWSADGTTLQTEVASTVALPDTDNARTWVRVTHDVDNGAGGNEIKFYTSADGVTWTQLGATVTGASTTSIYDATTVAWDLGARDGAAEPFIGKIYAAHIMSGIDGYPLNPVPIDSWRPYDTSSSFVGAPELWIVNGSVSGAGLTYLDDSTRRPIIMPRYGQTAAIVSVSHNQTTNIGAASMEAYATFVTNIKTRLPFASVVFTTQNPRTSPALYVREHAIRQGQMMAWARQNGVGVVDAYSAFNASPSGLATLVETSDGIHPTAAGSQLWAATVQKAMTYSH